MSLQQPGSGEGFAAHLTHTGQRVCPDVHLERSQAHVLLLTVLAAEVLLAAPLTAQRLVFGQAREAQVLIVTAGTLEAARRDGWKQGGEGEGRSQEALWDFQAGCGFSWSTGVRGATAVNL